jgi:hypothetical protein
MDRLPPLDWFGPVWDAELCATKQRVKTPVGRRCYGCGGIITYSAQGVIAPESDEHGVRLDPWHLRCFRRSNALGSDQI